VVDEKSVGKSLGRPLFLENIDHVYCNSAKDALKEIQSARTPFSLIISDQRMPGGMGTDFLEQAKIIVPDTICFLITAHSDLKTVIESVNRGAVYKYIIKPWDNEALLDNITVNEELVIHGDVDFNTGNISFNGNIVVQGTIKPGFEVKGVNLTADAIEGATVELTGDLNVSYGMIDTMVRTVGRIHTKFINNCTVFGFNDFVVYNEIVDSTLTLGGHCLIPTGHIITTSISAKKGIKAKNIGSISSTAPVLSVGIDDHANHMEKESDIALEKSLRKIFGLKKKVNFLENSENKYHRMINDLAGKKEMYELEITQFQNQRDELAVSRNASALSGLKESTGRMRKKIADTDVRIHGIFEELDSLSHQIDTLKHMKEIICSSWNKKRAWLKSEKKKYRIPK